MLTVKDGDGFNPFVFNCFSLSSRTKRGDSGKVDGEQNMDNYSEGNEFVCPHCPYKTIWKQALKKHLRIHDEKETFCTYCGYKAVTKRLLLQHIRECHQVTFCCDHCPYKCRTKALLKSHLLIHDNNRNSCPKCDFKSVTSRDMFRHLRSSHELYACFRCTHKNRLSSPTIHLLNSDEKRSGVYTCPVLPPRRRYWKQPPLFTLDADGAQPHLDAVTSPDAQMFPRQVDFTPSTSNQCDSPISPVTIKKEIELKQEY